jgi:hypothetical protein
MDGCLYGYTINIWWGNRERREMHETAIVHAFVVVFAGVINVGNGDDNP